MHSSSFHTLPPFFLLLVLLFGLLIAILQIGILGYAYEKMGISRRVAYLILFLSLAGSYVNVPVAELPKKQQVVGTQPVRDRWGLEYWVPVIDEWPGTVVAVNVGGAVIPTLLSIYLVVRHQIYGQAALGILVVTVIVHALAQPVPQMGISVPIFIPPVAAALVAMFLSRDYAAPLAYVSGCMGTLVGADVMNIHRLGELGASIASIGGAGTFDGVFLTGVLAVLLAMSPVPAAPRRTRPLLRANRSRPRIFRDCESRSPCCDSPSEGIGSVVVLPNATKKAALERSLLVGDKSRRARASRRQSCRLIADSVR